MPHPARLAALLLLAVSLAGGAAHASSSAKPAVVSAGAYGITVIVPGQPSAGAASASAPGTAVTGAADAFAHPADGSAARTGALSSSVSARDTGVVGAQAVTDVLDVSLFAGEITATSVSARAKVSDTGADVAGSAVQGLVVLGQGVAAAPNQRVPLGDWGYVVTLEQSAGSAVASGTRSASAALTGLHVVLTADHGGLPAGSEILVGHAEAAASTPVEAAPEVPKPPATVPQKPGRPAGVPPKKRPQPTPKPPRAIPGIGGPLFEATPENISAPLSPQGYVFPVYGDASFSDSWLAPRASTGKHLGTDIFAALGAPILAAADGTVFSVGWNRIGGWRLWLRDRQGNQFYYAHLAAYTPLARNGAEVRAGQVLGFNGNSGDAEGTPFHLHFEIHPVGLLPLGYEGGAVNPYDYLVAWRRVADVSFSVGRGWAPPVPANARAPLPAAMLLGSTDISSASGLEPGSLERALVAQPLALRG